MSSASVKEPRSLDELESDLASIASEAALELDHLVLGRSKGLSATQRLVDVIANAVKGGGAGSAQHSLLNPATAVALGKAIDEALHAGQAKTPRLPELLQQANGFKDRLATIVHNPTGASPAEVQALRNFCVALSKQAMAVDSATRYRHEHPFKKYL